MATGAEGVRPLMGVAHVRRPGAASTASMHVLIDDDEAEIDLAADPVDDWRGLTALGHRRAHRLVEHLRGVRIDQVLSSPALRCRQTVVPLAEDRGLDIEPVLALAHGADLATIAGIINDPRTANAAICADPCTIERLLDRIIKAPASEVAVGQEGPAVVLYFTRVPPPAPRRG
jgi:phosphohistidine phosphatase SixA